MYRRTIEEMKADAGEILVLDLRKPEDFKKETLPGAVNIYWEELAEKTASGDFSDFPKDRPVYLFCYTEQRSDDIAECCQKNGYENVFSIEGGISAWFCFQLSQAIKEEKEGAEYPDIGLGEGESGNKKKKTLTRAQEAERSIVKKFKKEIWRNFTKAINEYRMIEDGDRIAVCISGGKDSMLMAKLFQELKRHGRNNFEVVFLVMNPGYNQINYQTILDNARLLDIPITVFESQIFDSVVDIQDSPCYLCARMRRGYLYSKAKELGCNKIALGHHFDDVIETIVMGMMYGGQIQTMMPKLHSTNFDGMELIRPLYLIRERDIIHWANYNGLHFIQCACRFTERNASRGEGEKVSRRSDVKKLIASLEQDNPYVPKNIFRSVENVNLSTVIAWKKDGEHHHFLDTYEDAPGQAQENEL